MDAPHVAARFLDAVARRDVDAVGSCFAPGAELWALTPKPQVRTLAGPAEIRDRYAAWLDLLELEVVSSDVDVVADRVRLRYRFRGRDREKGWQENEHTAYARVEDDLIAAMTLTCAGFRPIEAPR